MGVLKTLTLGATLALGLASSGAAFPASTLEQAKVFATCLGRFSAVMEHEWLLGHSGEDAQRRRASFEMLLDAVSPAAMQGGLSGAQLLHMRIEAKHAHARLLQLARYDLEERRATGAARLARTQLGMCETLVLG